MATQPTRARAEVTLKFSELPEPTPVPGDGKRVTLRFSVPPFTFVAKLRNKSINKARRAIDEHDEWTGALVGKLGSTVDGKLVCELEEAGLQIFERKPAIVDDPAEPAPATS